MATSADIERQISQAMNKRAQARSAEQTRLAEEQRHQREAQEAEAEIAQLRAAQRQAVFNEAQEHNQELLAANQADAQVLVTALDALVQFWGKTIQPSVEVLTNSFKKQVQYTDRVAQSYIGDPFTDFQEADVKDYDRRAREHARRKAFAAYQGLPNGAAPAHVAIEWINGASSKQERLLRQRLVFVLTGQLYDPAPGYNAQAQTGKQLTAERARRFLPPGF